MGKSKETVVQQGSSQTSYTPAPYEPELNKLQYEQAVAADPGQREVNANAFNVINKLLTGDSQGLPGFLGDLARGIDPSVTQGLVDNSLRDMNAQLKKSGAGSFLESGPSQSMGVRTAGDIRLASEESNLNRLLNLLNIGVGGQAQIQQPILATSQMLSGRLAGLRGSNTTTQGSTTSYGMNPFLASFSNAAGKTLGSPSFGFGGNVPGGFQF